MSDRQLIAAGAVFGMLGVILGAFGAHALESQLPAHRIALWETASRYQMYHSLALVAVGIIAGRYNVDLTISGWLFTVGIVIFCGTVYALALDAPRWFGAITPIGGIC